MKAIKRIRRIGDKIEADMKLQDKIDKVRKVGNLLFS
jgi:hypothetical protein